MGLISRVSSRTYSIAMKNRDDAENAQEELSKAISSNEKFTELDKKLLNNLNESGLIRMVLDEEKEPCIEAVSSRIVGKLSFEAPNSVRKSRISAPGGQFSVFLERLAYAFLNMGI